MDPDRRLAPDIFARLDPVPYASLLSNYVEQLDSPVDNVPR